ncbi:MAG: HAMP domain-containing protein, partial [Actinomycetota bacterium]
MSPKRPGGERRPGGLPLAVYVLALLIVPLTAVGVFGSQEIAQNDTIVASTNRHAALLELRAAAGTMRVPLQVERLRALQAVDRTDTAMMDGLDIGLLAGDSETLLRTASERVDDALAEDVGVAAGWGPTHREAVADLWDVIDRAESENPPSTQRVVAAFDEVETTLDRIAQLSREESDLVVPTSTAEVIAADRIGDVIDVASTAAAETAAMIDAIESIDSPAMSAMVGSTLRHADALAAAASSDQRGRIIALEAEYDSLSAISGDVVLGTSVVPAPRVYEALDRRIRYLGAVADFAVAESDDALAVIDERRASAETSNRNMLLAFAGIGVVTLAFGAIVLRSFAKPLTRLRVHAERISRGELTGEPIPLGGPSDVRKVTGALNEMSSTLALVDVHMQALAINEAEHAPDLGELPGRVGASMRTSMERVTALTGRLKASEARLAEEARIDHLTGLPNR